MASSPQKSQVPGWGPWRGPHGTPMAPGEEEPGRPQFPPTGRAPGSYAEMLVGKLSSIIPTMPSVHLLLHSLGGRLTETGECTLVCTVHPLRRASDKFWPLVRRRLSTRPSTRAAGTPPRRRGVRRRRAARTRRARGSPLFECACASLEGGGWVGCFGRADLTGKCCARGKRR
eukprot:gene12871-biopygen16971